jgi:hypothetical protein
MNAKNNNTIQQMRDQTRINDISVELMFSTVIKGEIEKEIITSGEDGYPQEIVFDIEESWLCGVGGGDYKLEGYDKDYDDWQWGTDTSERKWANAPPLLKIINQRYRDDDYYEIDCLDDEDAYYRIIDFGLKYNSVRGWDLRVQLKLDEMVQCCISGEECRKSDCLYNSTLDCWIYRENYEGFDEV